jgi:hypothetical protein
VKLACYRLLLVAALGWAQAAPPAALVEVQVASARYESLQNDALRFFRAVRNGDKPAMARLTPSAVQDAVRKDLDDPTSPVARLLLTGSRAMRGRFMSVQTPRLTFLRERSARDTDDRVIVCFSDPRQEFRPPPTTAELPVADSNRAETCLSFTDVDKHWQVVLPAR